MKAYELEACNPTGISEGTGTKRVATSSDVPLPYRAVVSNGQNVSPQQRLEFHDSRRSGSTP